LNEANLDDNFHLARKKYFLELRARLIQNIRQYFINYNYLEVETPLRIPAPAPEEHIEAFPSADWFLQTSPELCMKRLLAAGYGNIFQISHCFRQGERGKKHLPEFTMLEWYTLESDYFGLMNQCQDMLCAVFRETGYKHQILFQNKKIDMSPPWEKITVIDAFARFAHTDCESAIAADKFDEILVEKIEPCLGVERPVFLYDYPAKYAALARTKKDDPQIAERFELYIGSLEIANGFSELTRAAEQRKRFGDAQKARAAKNWLLYPLPEKFLSELEKMPAAAGIALGIDRLVMLLADTQCIDDVVAFTPETL